LSSACLGSSAMPNSLTPSSFLRSYYLNLYSPNCLVDKFIGNSSCHVKGNEDGG
jgi:hypothetical protein